MKETRPISNKEQEVNIGLRETLFSKMIPKEIERAEEYLDSLSLEEQNSCLNIITTWMADFKTRG